MRVTHYIRTEAIFLWRHAQGGKLKCCKIEHVKAKEVYLC